MILKSMLMLMHFYENILSSTGVSLSLNSNLSFEDVILCGVKTAGDDDKLNVLFHSILFYSIYIFYS